MICTSAVSISHPNWWLFLYCHGSCFKYAVFIFFFYQKIKFKGHSCNSPFRSTDTSIFLLWILVTCEVLQTNKTVNLAQILILAYTDKHSLGHRLCSLLLTCECVHRALAIARPMAKNCEQKLWFKISQLCFWWVYWLSFITDRSVCDDKKVVWNKETTKGQKNIAWMYLHFKQLDFAFSWTSIVSCLFKLVDAQLQQKTLT